MGKSRYYHYLWLFIFLIAIVLIFFSNEKNVLREIPALIHNAHWMIVIIMIGCQLVFYLLDGLLSWTALRIVEVKVHPRHAISASILSAIGGKIIPFIGASLSSFFLYKKLNVETKKIAFLVTVWNIFYTLSFAASFAFALIILPQAAFKFVSPIIFDAISIIFAGIIFGTYISLRKHGQVLLRFVSFLKKLKIGRRINEDVLQSFVDTLFEDIDFMKKKKGLSIMAFFFSALYYFDNVALLYLSFLVFGFKPDLASLVIAFSLGTILSLLSLTPEIPGVTEASLIVIFAALGYPTGLTALASVLYRLISYWLLIPIGLFFYFKYWSGEALLTQIRELASQGKEK